jgi:hypothetical protein
MLSDADKHLDVALSVHRGRDSKSGRVVVTLSTVVHIHNELVRLNMLPMVPVYKLIVSTVFRVLG